MFAKIKDFIKEVKVELGKVSWPTKNEIFGSTVIVMITVAILSIFIGFCDLLFSSAVHLIIK